MRKSILSEEYTRMQRLAGILSESEYKEALSEEETNLEQSIEKALSNVVQNMNAQANKAQPSPKDKEVNEVALTLASLAVGAPGLMSFLGKAADGIADIVKKGTSSDVFKKDTYSKGGSKNLVSTKVGSILKSAGHKLEDKYLESIGSWLQHLYPSKFKGQDVHDKTSKLYDAAHGIYAALLVGAAITSGVEAIHASSSIMGGLEGGLSAFKQKEVLDIAQKIAAA